MHEYSVLSKVVARDLCIGCGICVGVCPHDSLCMETIPGGDLVAGEAGPCVDGCDICLRFCPFTTGVHDPRELNRRHFAGLEREHPDTGRYLNCFVGHSLRPGEREAAASGGLLTWTLGQLLERDLVDAVSYIQYTPLPDSDEGFGFRFALAESAATLTEAAGTVYAPVEISQLLLDVIKADGPRVAVAGVPCLMSGLRLAAGTMPKVARNFRYQLGLACGGYQNRSYTELLLAAGGIDRRAPRRIHYRGKDPARRAIDYFFQAEDSAGRPGRRLHNGGLPGFLGLNGYFRMNACNHCRDVFAEAADACFMDAWLPEYMRDARGTSLVLLRNPELAAILEEGREAGEIALAPLPVEKVLASQAGVVARKRGKPASGIGARLRERLKQRSQERSKRAWTRWGGRHRAFFWLAMADLVIPQLAFHAVGRLKARLRR